MRAEFLFLSISWALASTAAPAFAQVPDGACVVVNMELDAGPPLDLGGIYFVDLISPTPTTTSVAGLPVALTGESGGALTGARSVAIRDDGSLLVGEVTSGSGSVDLFEVQLAGSHVASYQMWSVGTSASGGAIRDIEMLPNGDAVIRTAGLDSTGPLQGEAFGVWSSQDGSVSPIDVDYSGFAIGMAVSRDGQRLFVVAGMFPSGYDVLEVPIAGGPTTTIASLSGSPPIVGVASDSQDDVLAVAIVGATYRVDVDTGSVTSISRPGARCGLAVEPSTDYLYSLSSDGYGRVYRLTPTFVTEVCYQMYEGAQLVGGRAIDLELRGNPREYGRDTPGDAIYRWQVAPGPGGLPRAGNSSFAFQLNASSGDASGAVLIGANEASVSLLGVDIHVLPDATFPMPASGFIPLPPLPVEMLGAPLRMQSVHLDSGAPQGIAASPGYAMTVMP